MSLLKRLPLLLILFASQTLASSLWLTCPKANALKLGAQQRWSASAEVQDTETKDTTKVLHFHWRSTDPSLSTQVSQFVGAQYVGNTEGHITCLYLPTMTGGTQAFPIILFFQNLADRPQGKNWVIKKGDSSTVNCISDDPANCVYSPYRPPVIHDPYKALFNMKRRTPVD